MVIRMILSTVPFLILLSLILLSSIENATSTLICGDKAKRGKSCGTYTKCSECVECESDCSWCAVGGLCSRFCFGTGITESDCTDDGCVKSTEYKCMQIGNSNYANTDYEREGGIDQGKGHKKIFKPEHIPGAANQEQRKARSYSPFAWVTKDVVQNKKQCPDCKDQNWLGRDDGQGSDGPGNGIGGGEGIGNLRGG